MNVFFLMLGATCLTGIGASDQRLLARMSDVAGRRATLLVVAVATASIATAIAAGAGRVVTPQLSAPARLLGMALALALAGARLLQPVPTRPLREPTNSLGAAAIVLFALQISDAGRLIILATGLGGMTAGGPAAAIAGGTLGSAAVLAIGWHGGNETRRLAVKLQRGRRAAGLVVILAAAAAISMAFGAGDRFWQSLAPHLAAGPIPSTFV